MAACIVKITIGHFGTRILSIFEVEIYNRQWAKSPSIREVVHSPECPLLDITNTG